ncbi:ABC transporter [Pandoraea terrae]|uniref:ABC transporter n=1 Tax=Pandoraea terrae TaxID=1537710 RepID=A0A5E4YEJ0_9BURK|nr:ABC-type transport auxiliary lipoprotein family protein [Pandoraea terrae]VVE46818.1 ABC transporter [Pandoraea terrae]
MRIVRHSLCAVALAATLWLAACATGPAAGAVGRFDLGPPPVAAQPQAGVSRTSVPPLKVVVSAPSWLDTDAIFYRLPATDGQQARAYANSRWLASPARLFGDRLRGRFAADHAVLGAGDPLPAPVLRVELEEFSQYFDTNVASRGVVQVRATLLDGTKLRGQTTLRADAPAPTADAAGGARALAAASDAIQLQLAQWLAAQPR